MYNLNFKTILNFYNSTLLSVTNEIPHQRQLHCLTRTNAQIPSPGHQQTIAEHDRNIRLPCRYIQVGGQTIGNDENHSSGIKAER